MELHLSLGYLAGVNNFRLAVNKTPKPLILCYDKYRLLTLAVPVEIRLDGVLCGEGPLVIVEPLTKVEPCDERLAASSRWRCHVGAKRFPSGIIQCDVSG